MLLGLKKNSLVVRASIYYLKRILLKHNYIDNKFVNLLKRLLIKTLSLKRNNKNLSLKKIMTPNPNFLLQNPKLITKRYLGQKSTNLSLVSRTKRSFDKNNKNFFVAKKSSKLFTKFKNLREKLLKIKKRKILVVNVLRNKSIPNLFIYLKKSYKKTVNKMVFFL